MFTKRHEQELAEIKALTQELGQRVQQILEQLEEGKGGQDELPKQDGRGAQEAGAARANKRARKDRGQATAAGAGGTGKQGRRTGKAGARNASAGPKAGKRRRAGADGSSGNARRQPGPAPVAGPDED
jgi:hypothetical protein